MRREEVVQKLKLEQMNLHETNSSYEAKVWSSFRTYCAEIKFHLFPIDFTEIWYFN